MSQELLFKLETISKEVAPTVVEIKSKLARLKRYEDFIRTLAVSENEFKEEAKQLLLGSSRR